MLWESVPHESISEIFLSSRALIGNPSNLRVLTLGEPASITCSLKGAGPRSGPPPLWEVAEGCPLYGGWLPADKRDLKQCHDKKVSFERLSVEIWEPLQSTVFQKRLCAGWTLVVEIGSESKARTSSATNSVSVAHQVAAEHSSL